MPEARLLLHGGTVYSTADPFATAMLVAGGEVAWVGSKGAALAMADGVDEAMDLDGAIVVPAFVDACSSGDGAAALRHGIGMRIVAERGGGTGGTAVIPASGDGAADAGGLLLVRADGLGGAPAAIERLDGRRGLLVLTSARLTDVELLAAAAVPVCLLPDGDGRVDAFPVAALAAAGVPFCFGGPGLARDPWSVVAAAVGHADPTQRISARAAFAACSRGGWRAAGLPEAGALVPGAPAYFAVWGAGDLVVAAPDDRIAAWSTDPRSGTPGLPDLSDGAPRPVCLRTVVGGRTAFRA